MINILPKILTFFKKIKGHGKGISILIPFRSSGTSDYRTKNLAWLKSYWHQQLPASQIIIGSDPETEDIFSKAAAVNNAAKSAKGDIFVIIDADCYLDKEVVLYAAEEIRKARKTNRKLWFVPYRKFYRLSEKATQKLLNSSPKKPYKYAMPVNEKDILDVAKTDADPATAHWFGAAVQIVPREAFFKTNGWDPRFRGWGGEDRAALEATDTLYWPHKTIQAQCLHMWHPMLGMKGSDAWISWKERMWENQTSTSSNGELVKKYSRAAGNIKMMQEIIDAKLKFEEELEYKKHTKWQHIRHHRHHRHHHCHRHHRPSA